MKHRKENEHTRTSPELLVVKFQIDPDALRELVDKVIAGVDPEFSRADLLGIIRKAIRREIAAMEESEHHLDDLHTQHHLRKVVNLEQYVNELSVCAHQNEDGFEFDECEGELILPGNRRAFVGRAERKHLRQIHRVLGEMDFNDRRSFPIHWSDNCLAAVYDWFSEALVDSYVILVLDDAKDPIALANVSPDNQFPSFGRILMGIVCACNTLALREALLNSIIQRLQGRFRTLEAHVASTQEAAISAFRSMEFDELEIPSCIPDGMGGFASKLTFYKQLVTPEEYAVACD